MPHYLVKGARQSDATDKTIVVYALSEREAVTSANDCGLFVASVEALDAGQSERPDAGHPSAIRPLCTMLRDAGRVQDGIDVLLWTYEMDAAAGRLSPVEAYLRVPKYLAYAKRFNEAIEYLHRMKRGRVIGWPIEAMGPHGLYEVFDCLAEMYLKIGVDRLSECYFKVASLAQLANDYAIASETVACRTRLANDYGLKGDVSCRQETHALHGNFPTPSEVLEWAIEALMEIVADRQTCEHAARTLFKGEGWIDYPTATAIAVRAESVVAQLLDVEVPG